MAAVENLQAAVASLTAKVDAHIANEPSPAALAAMTAERDAALAQVADLNAQAVAGEDAVNAEVAKIQAIEAKL